MGLGARWHEIARTYADVNMAFGDIVKVTPSSKVVGDMAIFLVNHNMTMEQFEQLDAGSQPDAADVGDRYVHGVAGRAGRRLAEEAAEDHSARRQAAAGPARRASADGRSGRDGGGAREEDRPQAVARRGAQLPDVSRRLPEVRAQPRQNWGDVDVLPTPQFFYGMERGDDIAVELEPGKALVIKFLTVGEPHPDGTRTVFFELNGQPREVTVRDRKLEVKRAGQAEGRPECSRDRSARRFRAWFRRSRWS